MKTVEDSISLAREMVSIGENAGRKVAALITGMDIPLGYNIGNSLEVKEAVETLKGQGPEDLTRVSQELAANMLYLAGKGDMDSCRQQVKQVIADGSALERLIAMTEAQGGDSSVLRNPDLFAQAACHREVPARESGYIAHMDTEGCGIASCMLGAGRETKDSAIDYAAGIILHKKTGDYVKKGETLAVLYAAEEGLFAAAEEKYMASITVSQEKPAAEPLIYARVTADGVQFITDGR